MPLSGAAVVLSQAWRLAGAPSTLRQVPLNLLAQAPLPFYAVRHASASIVSIAVEPRRLPQTAAHSRANSQSPRPPGPGSHATTPFARYRAFHPTALFGSTTFSASPAAARASFRREDRSGEQQGREDHARDQPCSRQLPQETHGRELPEFATQIAVIH